MDETIPAFDRPLHADALARNPLLQTILREMRADCLATWESSSNLAQREEQWFRLKVIRDFEAHVNRAIEDGKLAAGREERARRQARAER